MDIKHTPKLKCIHGVPLFDTNGQPVYCDICAAEAIADNGGMTQEV